MFVITTKLPAMSGKLQKELRQTKPFTSLMEEAILNIMRTAEVLSGEFNELLKQYDLTGSQYNVLRILRGALPEGISCSQISERMLTKDSDITRLLDRLDGRGLIARERDSKDRRVITTRITEDGLRVLKEMDGPVAEHQKQILGHLSEKQLATLVNLLEEARSRPEERQ